MLGNSIKLLPEIVANQIAAGEVIQRPASVVKELLENAIDSGAEKIQLIIKDSGKSLIQIIDNGSGMNKSDAELCFVRHATSKISSAEDLFSIKTKGFRGEALASIASISQVILKTNTDIGELGTVIEMEGGKLMGSESGQTSKGTSISVKNIFFNVPARRKFLKSDAIENRHIIDEFIRVALIHPEIAFVFNLNENEIYHLEKGNFKQRIISIFGKNYNDKLVPIEENTDIVNISGFILKPEYAKKTRGEQFFFANKRFIKHHYLHHAVSDSFSDLITANSFPSYFIEFDVKAENIDVNIHPTKTEIKFIDEKYIYAILKASVKKSLNQYSVAPTLDFNQENSFDAPIKWDAPLKIPEIKVNKNYNPFNNSSDNTWNNNNSFSHTKKSDSKNWEKLYENLSDLEDKKDNEAKKDFLSDVNFEKEIIQTKVFPESEVQINTNFYRQLKNKYILTENTTGFILIDQKRAHERVLFEHFLNSLSNKKQSTQQLLFPETIELTALENTYLIEFLDDLNLIGFEISPFGKNTYVINGMPSDFINLNAKSVIEELIEELKKQNDKIKLDKHSILAKNLARNMAIKYGQSLQFEEMKTLCEQLFLCSSPMICPVGKPTLINYNLKEIEKLFG